jgi:hypothetical protein
MKLEQLMTVTRVAPVVYLQWDAAPRLCTTQGEIEALISVAWKCPKLAAELW